VAGEFLRGLSLLLYPLERGSGMKVKVLEAIASGLPVVTTPAGAEGIEAGEGVVVESEPERLAAAAATILRDESERRERGAAARAAFERAYTPGPATAPIADLYNRMI
jgi:glycosyltransferase involved in cell wall biosynthesis